MKPERREHKGHSIEVRAAKATRGAKKKAHKQAHEAELLIDGELVPFGQLPDGSFYLDEYAYDPQVDLMTLATRFVDYRIKADALRRGDAVEEG